MTQREYLDLVDRIPFALEYSEQKVNRFYNTVDALNNFIFTNPLKNRNNGVLLYPNPEIVSNLTKLNPKSSDDRHYSYTIKYDVVDYNGDIYKDSDYEQPVKGMLKVELSYNNGKNSDPKITQTHIINRRSTLKYYELPYQTGDPSFMLLQLWLRIHKRPKVNVEPIELIYQFIKSQWLRYKPSFDSFAVMNIALRQHRDIVQQISSKNDGFVSVLNFFNFYCQVLSDPMFYSSNVSSPEFVHQIPVFVP